MTRTFLIWPDEYRKESVIQSYGMPVGSFIFVRPNDPRTWVHMKAGRGFDILDPLHYCEFLRDIGEFVRSRGANIISGRDECLSYLEAKARKEPTCWS